MRYRIDGFGRIQTLNISEDITEAIISELVSATNYSIEVAAVNRVGTGVYSSAVYFITKGKLYTQFILNFFYYLKKIFYNKFF